MQNATSTTRARRAALAIALAAGGLAIPSAAPAQGDELPHFERAEVELVPSGSYDRALSTPPPIEAPPAAGAPEPAHAEPAPAPGAETEPAEAEAGGEEHVHEGGVTTGAATSRRGEPNPNVVSRDDRPGPGWSVAAALPIDGQFVVLDWEGGAHAAFQVRSHDGDGWTGWVGVHSDPDEAPDAAAEPGSGEHAVGPIFVGEGTDAVEVYVSEGHPDDLGMTVMKSVEPEGWVDQAPAPVPARGATAANALSSPTGLPEKPPMYGRSAWGAGGWAYGNPGCEDGPRSASSLRFAAVHHTVSTNDYSPSQADDQIRAIWDFHVHGRGWCDIGYNFVVDKYGTVWEGRSGSIAQPTIGGHASGFNTASVGVVLLGQYQPGASPTAGSVSTAQYLGARDLIAWKFGLHGVDAKGTTTETSGGSTSIPAGQVVTISTIVGHRNLGTTSCPGDNAFVHVPTLRNDVAARVNAAPPGPSRTAAARNADGRVEVFALSATGALHHGWQAKPNGAGGWIGWHQLGNGKWFGGAAAAANQDGRLEVFVRDAGGRIYHAWQHSPNGQWSGFENLGGSARSDPAVGINKDGRLEAYYTGTDGRIYHNWQWKPGGNWSGWFVLGGSGLSNAPALGSNKDGRQEVLVIGNDGQAWHAWQQVPNGGWSVFHPFGGDLTGDGAVALNPDGRLELFALGKDGKLWHNWQWSPNGTKGWSGWWSLDGSFVNGPSVTLNHDGRVELFTFGRDGKIWHNWQWSPGGAAGWSGWWPLSSALR
jgi:hypothetical protein